MVKKLFIVSVGLVLGVNAWAQQQAIGIRAGDPVGITYKKYFSGSNAFEFIFGTASRSWHQNYYRNSFNEFDKYEDRRYLSHHVESTIYLQGRYLLHNDIMVDGMEGSWQWYWGAGALLKLAKVEYRFQEDLPPYNIDTDVSTDIDLGPEGIIGTEYTFEDLPITFFGEASLFIELADRPATLRAFGALGMRLTL